MAFTFQTSFYGLNSWDKRQAELFHWRAIINEYSEFDGFLANIFSPFLIDQRKTIAPSSMQSVGSAIAVMALISMFFLPDRVSLNQIDYVTLRKTRVYIYILSAIRVYYVIFFDFHFNWSLWIFVFMGI